MKVARELFKVPLVFLEERGGTRVQAVGQVSGKPEEVSSNFAFTQICHIYPPTGKTTGTEEKSRHVVGILVAEMTAHLLLHC